MSELHLIHPGVLIALVVELGIYLACKPLPIKWLRAAGYTSLFAGGMGVGSLGASFIWAATPWSANAAAIAGLQVYVLATATWLAWKNTKPF